MRSLDIGPAGAPETTRASIKTTTPEHMSIRATKGIDRFLVPRTVKVIAWEPLRPDRGRCPAEVLSSTVTILQQAGQKYQSSTLPLASWQRQRRRVRRGNHAISEAAAEQLPSLTLRAWIIPSVRDLRADG